MDNRHEINQLLGLMEEYTVTEQMLVDWGLESLVVYFRALRAEMNPTPAHDTLPDEFERWDGIDFD